MYYIRVFDQCLVDLASQKKPPQPCETMTTQIPVVLDDIVYTVNVPFGPDCGMTFGIHSSYADPDEKAQFVRKLFEYVRGIHGYKLMRRSEQCHYLFTLFYTENNEVFIVKHRSPETITRERIEAHFKNHSCEETTQECIERFVSHQTDWWQCIVRIIDKRDHQRTILFNNITMLYSKTQTTDTVANVSDVFSATSI